MKRKEMIERSLLLRNEIINKLKEELNIDFYFSYNDLYKVKGGEVRRLKGRIFNEEFRNLEYNDLMKLFNDRFVEVKRYLKGLKFEDFEIEFNKLNDIGVDEYVLMKNKGYEGNWEDYKNEKYYKEMTLILSIRWKY